MFPGFDEPTANFSKLPHQLINAFDQIETFGELKVILYILRHTWGFQERRKKITMDEFEHGRKRRDRTRMDNGTGLSGPTIANGLKRAVAHGFIEVEVDDRDLGRVKRYYSLRMGESLPQEPTGTPKTIESPQESLERGKETLPRTEKDTEEKDTTRKNDIIPQATPVGAAPPAKPKSRVSAGTKRKRADVPPAVAVFHSVTERYPPKSWFRDLEEKVTDLDRWEAIIKAYIGYGWNKRNVARMLQYYESNEVPSMKGATRAKGRGRIKQEAPSPETVRAFAEARRRLPPGVESLRPGPRPEG